ncbi:MAG: hypothetical protein ACFFD2_19605 [Promethearchaeota archaeon]
MSKEKMIEILQNATKPGVPSVVINTKDYIYCLVANDAELTSWKEASMTFPDCSLEEKDLPAGKALMLLIEELTKGLPGYVTDLPIAKNEGEIGTFIERIKSL